MRLHQADAINTLCSKTFLWSCLLPHFVNVTSHRTNYPKDRQAIQASAGSAKKVLFTPTHTHRLCLSAFPTPSNCTRLGSFFHGQRLPFTNILRRLTPLYRYHRVFLFGHGGRLFLRIPEQANAFLKLVPDCKRTQAGSGRERPKEGLGKLRAEGTNSPAFDESSGHTCYHFSSHLVHYITVHSLNGWPCSVGSGSGLTRPPYGAPPVRPAVLEAGMGRLKNHVFWVTFDNPWGPLGHGWVIIWLQCEPMGTHTAPIRPL